MGFLKSVLNGVSSIAAPITSVVNGALQSRENRKNREWTEQQNDLAWQRQNQLINEQRAYDTPKAQMKRLMDAGLNPNLIYDDLGGNLQAMSAPSASGNYAGVAPHIDPLAASQSLLNLAQIKKTEKDTEKSTAEISRIYNMTEFEVEKLKADANYIRQRITEGSFVAKVEEIKREILDSNGDFKFKGSDGNDIVTDLRSLIYDNSVKQLYVSNQELEKAIELFETEIGIRKSEKESIDLNNADLRKFVEVAARIYEGQASQADYIKMVSELNQQFYGKVGASNEVIKLIFGFLSMFIGGVSNFTPRKSTITHVHVKK